MRSGSFVRASLGRAAAFLRDDGGSLSVLTIGILPAMLVAGGMAVDYMHMAASRVRMQATLDRAVVAAAALTQTRDPEEVVRDYFGKAGLGDELASVQVEEALNFARSAPRRRSTSTRSSSRSSASTPWSRPRPAAPSRVTPPSRCRWSSTSRAR